MLSCLLPLSTIVRYDLLVLLLLPFIITHPSAHVSPYFVRHATLPQPMHFNPLRIGEEILAGMITMYAQVIHDPAKDFWSPLYLEWTRR